MGPGERHWKRGSSDAYELVSGQEVSQRFNELGMRTRNAVNDVIAGKDNALIELLPAIVGRQQALIQAIRKDMGISQ